MCLFIVVKKSIKYTPKAIDTASRLNIPVFNIRSEASIIGSHIVDVLGLQHTIFHL